MKRFFSIVAIVIVASVPAGLFWILNLVKFTDCDFDTPLHCEVVHGVGVFVPPTAIVTAFFGTDAD